MDSWLWSKVGYRPRSGLPKGNVQADLKLMSRNIRFLEGRPDGPNTRPFNRKAICEPFLIHSRNVSNNFSKPVRRFGIAFL